MSSISRIFYSPQRAVRLIQRVDPAYFVALPALPVTLPVSCLVIRHFILVLILWLETKNRTFTYPFVFFIVIFPAFVILPYVARIHHIMTTIRVVFRLHLFYTLMELHTNLVNVRFLFTVPIIGILNFTSLATDVTARYRLH